MNNFIPCEKWRRILTLCKGPCWIHLSIFLIQIKRVGQESYNTTSISSMDSDCGESYRCKYDVFISFRGPDTRNTFVNHLHGHLSRKGISTFKDDKSLQKGESISHQILQAIKDSRVSIVVFSKDYASSTWCLDEMAAIDESSRKLNQVVFPVFYDIDPSHVRKQSGVYEDAFVLHAELFKHNPDKVSQWKRAMTSLAGSAGWDVRNKPEFEEIEQIVQAVIKKLGHKLSGSADDLIGIQPRLEALESLSKDDDFQVLGIWGMDGIGKTTLATILYDKISYQFDACCYIENVCKVYEDGGAIALQKQILCQTIQEKILDAYSPSEIARIVRYRIQHIKLLVVLDNVDQIEQLQDLDIKQVLLHPESRLIIITRDEHILRAYGCIVYEVELMNDDEAHKLLCRKAFVSDYSSNTFSELIPEVLKYTQGLPLAIRVIGSFLLSRNVKQWRATLDRWKNSPPDKILKVLQVSYEGLEEEDKEIFLHVACVFKGERKDYVSRILDVCGLHPDIGIPLLAEKSLITIKNEEIHMHELLQDLGKKIVREKHPDEPGFWSRLWLYRDFHHVMMTEKVTYLCYKQQQQQQRNVVGHNGKNIGAMKMVGNCSCGGGGDSNFVNGMKLCSNCGKDESCVLILPCRHLCLCAVCGSSLHICPICKSLKSASIHVNMS